MLAQYGPSCFACWFLNAVLAPVQHDDTDSAASSAEAAGNCRPGWAEAMSLPQLIKASDLTSVKLRVEYGRQPSPVGSHGVRVLRGLGERMWGCPGSLACS